MKPTVLDLFAGCGGFSHGFAQAGFKVLGFVEWWKPAITTFLKNHPNAFHIGTDITKVPHETLVSYKGKVDIIVGGPPCQGFSLCGKRDPKDNRNKLYKEFLRFVSVIEPRLVVMENVKGLLSMRNQKNEFVIHNIVQDFIRLNYSVCYKILKASDYNVPQDRERLIIIAVKLNIFPQPYDKIVTVSEALQNIQLDCNAHEFLDTTPAILERIKTLKQGEKLSNKFNFCRQRLEADKPSKTIVTKPLYIHPTEDRFLTPRELARLQSFPDEFEFTGSKTSIIKQIGNAVPPLLSYSLAEKIMEVFYHG